jgi:hypothetical protein
MIRGIIIAVVLLGIGMTAGASQAQYRAKPPKSNAHFNPKELTIDQKAQWQKGRGTTQKIRKVASQGSLAKSSG